MKDLAAKAAAEELTEEELGVMRNVTDVERLVQENIKLFLPEMYRSNARIDVALVKDIWRPIDRRNDLQYPSSLKNDIKHILMIYPYVPFKDDNRFPTDGEYATQLQKDTDATQLQQDKITHVPESYRSKEYERLIKLMEEVKKKHEEDLTHEFLKNLYYFRIKIQNYDPAHRIREDGSIIKVYSISNRDVANEQLSSDETAKVTTVRGLARPSSTGQTSNG